MTATILIAIATMCGNATTGPAPMKSSDEAAFACQKYYVKCVSVGTQDGHLKLDEFKLADCLMRKQTLGGDK
jgi:hypothetical protein